MNKAELACQCRKCGQWNAVTTGSLRTATFYCKVCGSPQKLRGAKGWNINVKSLRSVDDNLDDLVRDLNGKRICKNCNRRIECDMEGDLIHIHLNNKGVDPRICSPSNPDSKIAEVKNEKNV